MFRFHQKYFLAFILLFLIELGIALFIRDKFIRPYLGDVLVVILLYCFIRSFINLKATTAAAAVLLFAFLIEFLQYLKVIELLGLQKNKILSTVLGSHFEWLDMLAYSVGVALILFFELFLGRRSPKNKTIIQ